MSSSTSLSPTSTFPSPTHSNTPHPSESGIQIPTTTVVGIGAGFVGFALSLLGTLLFIRFIRLAIKARREGIPVRTAWVDQGGFFGWIHGIGSRDNGNETDRMRRMDELERSGYWGGGGGWYTSEITRMRIWNEIRRENALAMRRGKEGEDLGDRPELWEVDLAEGRVRVEGKGGLGEDLDLDLDLVQYTPLSIGTRPPLNDTTTPRPPTIHLSLLIALPAPEVQPRTGPTDLEGDDLPELVIATTSFIPLLPHHREEEEEDEKGDISHLERISSPTDTDEKGKGVLEVAHLEYGQSHGLGDDASAGRGSRPAGWVKVNRVKGDKDKGEKWVIEGLEGCMSTNTNTGTNTNT